MRYLFYVLALLLSQSALAAEINFSTPITDQDNVQLLDCVGAGCTGPPLTLGSVAMRALSASFDDERSLPGEEKFKRGELALRVHKGGKIDLSVEDIALLKKLIAKGYGPIVVVRAWSILDPRGAISEVPVSSDPPPSFIKRIPGSPAAQPPPAPTPAPQQKR